MDGTVDHFLNLAGREFHVAEWGSGNPETVVLWHGLARTGADFEPLARELSRTWRLLVPDSLGRGLSQWAADPDAEYSFAFHERAVHDLFALFGLGVVRWVGTSMGGAFGIRLAGGSLRGRITHLVVNDIGPELPRPAVERILAYVGSPPDFATVAELEAWLRRVYQPYGYLPDEQWRRMAITSARRRDDGRVALHYDPAIVRQFVKHPGDYELWDAWDGIQARTLVLRGAQSDLLTEEIAARMEGRGPRPEILEDPTCGHAPALNVARQIDPVRRFLDG